MRKLVIGQNDLATLFPEIAKTAYGWDPTTTLAFSAKIKEWVCDKGHVTTTAIRNKTAHPTKSKLSCPFCSGQRVLAGFNDLATTHPEIAVQAYGWDPTKVSHGSTKRLIWMCEKYGHRWETAPNERTNIKNRAGSCLGCPVCSGHRVLAGFNDLNTLFPIIATEADGWDSTTVTPYSEKKRQWKCSDGHSWIAAVSNRTSGSTGCPVCRPRGFNPKRKGYLYLMRQPEWGIQQIGISTLEHRRTNLHAFRGWTLLDKIGPLPGEEIQNMELLLKHWLRSEKIPMGRKPDGSKFDGYTESWYEQDLCVETINELRKMTKTSKEWIFTK